MGEVVVTNNEVVYRQADGEITARLTEFEEKMELAHVGTPLFKLIFYLFVLLGVSYLCIIFVLY